MEGTVSPPEADEKFAPVLKKCRHLQSAWTLTFIQCALTVNTEIKAITIHQSQKKQLPASCI